MLSQRRIGSVLSLINYKQNKASNLPKVTQLENGTVWFEIEIVWWTSFPFCSSWNVGNQTDGNFYTLM